MFRFNGLANLGLIGTGISLLGSLFGFGGQQKAQAGADAAAAAQAEAMREYLHDYKSMRPYREYLGKAFSGRAGVPSRFSRAWGGQGSFEVPPTEQFYGRPDFPTFDQWKQMQEQQAGKKKPKDEDKDFELVEE